MPDKATIQTYATSANLGPLFDRAGAKLDGLYMTTAGQLTTTPGLTVVISNGAYPVPTDESNNLAHKVTRRIFNDYKIRDGLELSVTNDMKPGGLGTSGAGAVAVVELLNYLHGLGMTTEQKLDYALEGEPSRHPDNVVPCVIGGVIHAVKVGDGGQEHLVYSKLIPSPNLAYGVVIPLDIMKAGGTTKAREALEALRHSNAEAVYLSGLAELMLIGLLEGNFGKIWDGVKAYSEWEKSVTYVRNLPTEENPQGIYGIDVHHLNSSLEAVVGKEAIATPSGAGPAMLVFAKDPDVAQKAISVLQEVYYSNGKRANGFVASIRNQESKDDFIA